jgi:transposase
MEQVYLGIDISKNNLDVAIHSSNEQWRFPNDSVGITSLCKKLSQFEPDLVVFEATGGYEMPLYLGLDSAGLPATPINPRQIRKFAKRTGKLAKTDSLDAKMIAHFAYAIRPTPHPVPQTHDLKIAQIRRVQLLGMITAETIRSKSAPCAIRARIDAHNAWLRQDRSETD